MTDTNEDCSTIASIGVTDATKIVVRASARATGQFAVSFGYGAGFLHISEAALRRLVTEATAALARPVAGHDDGGVKGARDD